MMRRLRANWRYRRLLLLLLLMRLLLVDSWRLSVVVLF
jgi:hypothetical protein